MFEVLFLTSGSAPAASPGSASSPGHVWLPLGSLVNQQIFLETQNATCMWSNSVCHKTTHQGQRLG